jgi:hypothetical protein
LGDGILLVDFKGSLSIDNRRNRLNAAYGCKHHVLIVTFESYIQNMIAYYFQQAMKKEGYDAQLEGDKLFFSPLQMEMSFEELYTKGTAACVKVRITHPFLLPNGLQELAFGVGENEEERYLSSAEGWMQSDFPVIHAYLCPSENDLNVKRLELVSQTGNVQLGWNVLLGPLTIMGEGVDLGEDPVHKLFITLLNDVTGLLTSPGVIYLKFFLSNLGDGRVSTDCRWQGEDWPAGAQTLYHFAQQMNTNGKFHSRKQFLIIYPRPIAELKSGERMASDVRKEHSRTYGQKNDSSPSRKTKWYEFWK